MKNEKLRMIVEHDAYPDTSWLEQWDTPEKYYGGCPVCDECDDELDYVDGHEWTCVYCDDGARVHYDGSDNKDAGVMLVDGEPMPFDDYKQTYGDPNNHVFLCASMQERSACDGWSTVDSLGGIDVYDDGKTHWETGTFNMEDVAAMPDGYLKDTLYEMIDGTKGP
jgi:hypothetical protein